MNLSEKVEVVKNEFWKSVEEKSLKDLYMIDVMQRLNIDYHFKEEIEAFLGKQYVNCSNIIGSGYGDHIHDTALLFRLLRQQGYFVPAGGSTKLYTSMSLIFHPIIFTSLISYSHTFMLNATDINYYIYMSPTLSLD